MRELKSSERVTPCSVTIPLEGDRAEIRTWDILKQNPA